MSQNSVKALPLSTVASSTLTASYQSMNPSGFSHPVFFLRLVNGGSTAITVSYNGITDNDVVPANSVLEIPSQANSQPSAHYALWSARTQVYIKGTAGTGSITLAGYYV